MLSSLLNSELLSLFALLLLSGAFAGLLAGLFGVGGGIILVPALFYVFDELGYAQALTTHLAVGTSLAIIVPTSITSAWSHYKHGSGNIKLFRRLALPVAAGSLTGSFLAGRLSGSELKAIFAILALLIALNLFQKKHFVLGTELPVQLKLWSVTGMIGLFSAMMGIGGGVFFTSYLTAYSLPLLSSVGTSASLGLMISLPGVIGYVFSGWNNPDLPPLSYGYFNLAGFLCILPMTIIMVPQGAKLAHSLNKDILKRWFAVFLLLMSLRMFYKIYY
ncbi:MAG: sulfite exporter TauE/SafE family protein [SAR324 cluster bacterium]|nr:sulfite exporter TauE/SafE family protein [SAR324 cluster bacterium]MBL7034680.1 sulfite exporter TauE/SafE family protein [SAR324 cluster bacterium]